MNTLSKKTTCVDDSISPPVPRKINDGNDTTGLDSSLNSTVDKPTNFSDIGLADNDSDDDERNLQSVASSSITDEDDPVCHVIHQKGSIQENDLLLRNNRQVLHRLVYKHIMGIHMTN